MDGITYVVIGKLNAAGNSASALHYEWIDISPNKGTNFYRLKLVDHDNSSEYSKVLRVSFAKNVMVTLSPNPANVFVNVWIDGYSNTTSHIQLLDMNGKLLKQQFKPVNSTQPVRMNLGGLNKGIYILKIISENIFYTEKLVIN